MYTHNGAIRMVTMTLAVPNELRHKMEAEITAEQKNEAQYRADEFRKTYTEGES